MAEPDDPKQANSIDPPVVRVGRILAELPVRVGRILAAEPEQTDAMADVKRRPTRSDGDRG